MTGFLPAQGQAERWVVGQALRLLLDARGGSSWFLSQRSCPGGDRLLANARAGGAPALQVILRFADA